MKTCGGLSLIIKRKITLTQKITAGFSLLLLMLAFVGIVSIQSMRTGAKHAQTLADDFIPEARIGAEQAAYLEETSSSLEEISSIVKRNADHALAAKERARQSRTAAETGGVETKQMTVAMSAPGLRSLPTKFAAWPSGVRLRRKKPLHLSTTRIPSRSRARRCLDAFPEAWMKFWSNHVSWTR